VSFLREVFGQLRGMGDRPVLREGPVAATARELLGLVEGGRTFLRQAGVAKGDRVVLLGANGVRWTALDLAIMFEGAIAVPLYDRQAPRELDAMIRDCDPSLVWCGTPELAESVEANRTALFEDAATAEPTGPVELAQEDPVRIVYTSGTSGDAKGVILTAGNAGFMLPRTVGRLDELMAGHEGEERIFHYLPCCFAGSWVLLQTCLLRGSVVTFCTDLKRLGEELRAANPHTMLNVPLLLERIKAGIEEILEKRGGVARWIWNRPWLARWLLYPTVRRQIAPALRALVCGSAALAESTQRFFMMLGLPVLQVYGLTETTAICTMDRPGAVVPGRVGQAIDGCEMKLDENGEVCVRGPHVFPGYWGRAPRDGEWLATGDLGEVDESGNWRILGRRKFLLVLAGGHNVAPEPLEQALRLKVPGCTHVMLVGDGRKSLAALVAGTGIQRAHVERALEDVNSDVPHYKRIRAFHVCGGPLTPDDGLLTANGKLRRAAIQARFAGEIEELYR